MRRASLWIALTAAALLAIAGCGQKGPLYRPGADDGESATAGEAGVREGEAQEEKDDQ